MVSCMLYWGIMLVCLVFEVGILGSLGILVVGVLLLGSVVIGVVLNVLMVVIVGVF